QDGAVTFDRGGPGRLVEFEPKGSTFRPARQWRYPISPTPRVEGFDEICSDGENGLVELLAFSDTTLLSMERSCLVSKDKQFTANTVQLFTVELVDGDARKRLLLNFDSITSRLSSALSRLENFEAMTFGPIVNGMPTLLIGSDDNFRATQKTSFLLFGMR
ncbi:MAG TPA: esterase-like activity of phytase family protein, partial [Vicinamibacterales bacterium]|nr:esterase-like activity of phytase family protein [Vicinamibacterales bacterium]